MTGTSPPADDAGPGFPDEPDSMERRPDDAATSVFDYHRTVIGYHGTRRDTAESLVRGASFKESENDDDWLGHGVYFWEYAPQQAWWWAERRYGPQDAAVVGAMIRLGHCLDFLDPANGTLLDRAHDAVVETFTAAQIKLPENANNHKYRDCIVFKYLYQTLEDGGRRVDGCRAVFVPTGGRERYWTRSGVFRGSHIQLCIRNLQNILSIWHVRRDGRYGVDEAER